MATTGFWPVKSRLKEVIDYAENPDKTIDKKYVDSDLSQGKSPEVLWYLHKCGNQSGGCPILYIYP